ncbi:MAG TPA: MerR family transcriptional regulator [Jatrophihabitantaceae bacterium]
MTTSAEPTAESTVEELTVDELAARTGMTVRTVRFYATEGLLPAPVRRGRIAYYGTQHRMRLELVRELQDHGYTLAAIERVLAHIPHDASPADFAMQAAMFTPWMPERAEELDRAALERRAGRQLSAEDVDLLVSLGVVDPSDHDTFRTTPSVLGMGLELIDLPVPAAVLREAAEVIHSHAAAVADGLTDVFRRGIWEPFRRGETTDRDQLAVVVSRLRPLVVRGLVNAFGHAADRAIRRTVVDPP